MKNLTIDHLVLTVKNIKATCAFYSSIMDMEIITFGENRKAMKFNRYKINLHQQGAEIVPHAQHPTPGSADLCFVTDTQINLIIQKLNENNIKILEGPVQRTGANGIITSVYFRDPDNNLIEVSNY